MTNERRYRIARVCLTDGTVQPEEVNDTAVHRYLGGRGLGMYLLRSIPAERNPLIFATGPLTDSEASPGGRYCAVFRSALTGKPVSLSAGSGWGRMLKRTGLDGIIIEGEAPEWVYLSVEKGALRLHPAETCLGMLCGETARALKSLHGRNSCVLCIGPAGENLVPLSAIMCNGERAFSRHGIGKVMGAKKLKAIVVGMEDAGAIPDTACSRCPVPCRNKAGKSDSPREMEPGLSDACNEYGLDSFGVFQAAEAIRELQHRGIVTEAPADIREWVRQVSRRETEITVLAGEGLAALERVFGASLLPHSPKKARDRAKPKLTEEMTALIDAMGCCLFAAASLGPEECAGLLSDAAGIVCPPERILQFGTEILQLEETM